MKSISTASVAAAPHQPGIDAAMNNLQMQISLLVDSLESVTLRLRPLQVSPRLQSVSDVNQAPQPIPERCPLAEQIIEQGERVASLNQSAQNLLDSLDL